MKMLKSVTRDSFLACLLLLCATGPAFAEPAPPPSVPESAFGVGAVDEDDPRVEARLVADADTVRVGDTFRLGVLFDIDPDWHIYWRNSGESGLSTDIEHPDEESLTFSELHWPAPEVYLDPSGEVATFGYAKRTLLFYDVELSDTYIHPTLDVALTADFLACKVDCIPGRVELSRTLRVGPRERSAESELFDAYATREPLPLDSENLRAEFSTDRVEVHLNDEVDGRWAVTCEHEACDTLEVATQVPRYGFIPDARQSVAWRTRSTKSQGSTALITMRGQASPDRLEDCAARGVVYLQIDGAEPRPFWLEAPFACVNEERAEIQSARSEPAPAPETPNVPEVPLWEVLLLALIGGMILNLMPCVFPVLAIKVFSFVKLAHEERSSVHAHSAAYTSGIVLSMLALAGIVIALKAAGQQVGWGFQFQEPLFIAALAAILVAFALNLFGVFEITAGASAANKIGTRRDGLGRSFAEGILAVILATPCSAPLLGVAIGFAFASSNLTILSVFTALGVGLALPFVLLTSIPAWSKKLPRPGPWMVTFKQLLGFALLGTVVWLVWILGQLIGNDAAAQLLAFVTSVALAVWVWGKVQFSSRRNRWLGALFAVGFVTANAAYWLQFEEPDAETSVEKVESTDFWQPWSEDGVAEARANGKVVFVDFTADWCITCKVNENGPLAAPEVVARLASEDVVAMKADWTRRDDAIRSVLARYGKAGVPLYLVYAPEKDVQVLPELLTQKIVLDALDLAKVR